MSGDMMLIKLLNVSLDQKCFYDHTGKSFHSLTTTSTCAEQAEILGNATIVTRYSRKITQITPYLYPGASQTCTIFFTHFNLDPNRIHAISVSINTISVITEYPVPANKVFINIWQVDINISFYTCSYFGENRRILCKKLKVVRYFISR